jgi:murein L,D-transpeptidase YcbB/YkuD
MSFINDLAPAAQSVGRKYNVLPSLLISMACLESNFGQSGLASRGHNLFGVKGSYQGQSVTMATKEYINNQWVTIQAKFKSYPGWAESLEDVCLLFTNGVSWDRSKYHNLIGEQNIEVAAHSVQADGYCTDPGYGDKLMKIVADNNLRQYDGQAVTPPPAAPQPQQPTPAAIVPFPGTLRLGSRGVDVQRVQRAVGVTPDGVFGPKTQAAVRAYQQRHGLFVDGIVGPKTWNVMF